jgi:hypothetical protein
MSIIGKLGTVLYWACCIIAAVIATIVIAFLVLSDPRPDNWSMAASDLAVAFAVWLTGLVLRYLLARR